MTTIILMNYSTTARQSQPLLQTPVFEILEEAREDPKYKP